MREYIDLVNDDLLEEDAGSGASIALTHQGNGMMEQWQNEEVCLAGGWRTGGSPADYMRVGYSIIDVQEYLKTQDAAASDFGLVECYKNSRNQLAALINIKLDKTKRKAGIGGKVVRALVATYPDHFTIIDIRRPAVGFWKKMGAEFYTPNAKPVTAPGSFRGHDILVGVIRKAGSQTELSDLPAFYKRKPLPDQQN